MIPSASFLKKAARWHDNARARTKHAALAKAKAVTEVKDAAEKEALAYQLQGDATLSTKDAFRQRQKLRRNPKVLAELDKWWLAVVNTAKQRGRTEVGLRLEDWTNIYRLLYYELLGADEYDEADADSEAMSEWAEDSTDGHHMERPQFLDAIFEVCDLYTSTIEVRGERFPLMDLSLCMPHPVPPRCRQ